MSGFCCGAVTPFGWCGSTCGLGWCWALRSINSLENQSCWMNWPWFLEKKEEPQKGSIKSWVSFLAPVARRAVLKWFDCWNLFLRMSLIMSNLWRSQFCFCLLVHCLLVEFPIDLAT